MHPKLYPPQHAHYSLQKIFYKIEILEKYIYQRLYCSYILEKTEIYIEAEKGSGVDDLQISDSFIQLQLCSKLWQTNIRLSFFLKRLSPGSNNDPNVGKFINNQTGFVLICSQSVFKYFPNSSWHFAQFIRLLEL